MAGLFVFLTIAVLALTTRANPQRGQYGGGPPPWVQDDAPPVQDPNPTPPPESSSVSLLPSSTAIIIPTETESSGPPAESSSSPATPGDTSTTTTSNTCGGGGGGMQVQWAGDEVSYSSPVGSGTTKSGTCLDLTGFSGQVAIGGEGGSILEVNPTNFFDVSYILGFSVPVVCSGGDGMVTGCNKDLFNNGGKEGQVEKNPTGPGGSRDPGGYQGCATCQPWCNACSGADPFFAPCAGSAYTYPYDDGATVGPSASVTCCIGTNCPTTGREGSGAEANPQLNRDPPCGPCGSSSKRGLEEVLLGGNATAAEETRERKRHQHQARHSHRRRHGHGDLVALAEEK